ncbi:hypothetical protein, partial [Dietzia kunjamensis]|uniref:hypothetical protein n=1 Tax=Dietzia kunjamensis TaxID=322509 RepID=UPI0019D62C81
EEGHDVRMVVVVHEGSCGFGSAGRAPVDHKMITPNSAGQVLFCSAKTEENIELKLRRPP